MKTPWNAAAGNLALSGCAILTTARPHPLELRALRLIIAADRFSHTLYVPLPRHLVAFPQPCGRVEIAQLQSGFAFAH